MEEGGSTLNERVRLVYTRHGFPEETWFTWSFGPIRDESGRVGGLFNTCHEDTQQVLAERERERLLAELTEQQFRMRASEERYRRLVETAHEGVWTIDAAGRTTYVNRRMAELLGYAPQEMMGRVHTDFMWEQDRPKGDVDMELRRQGTAQVWDQRYRRKDGNELWTVASCSALHDTDGVFTGALGMFTDITDRKRAEGAVREREERLRLATETAELGIWVWQVATDRVVWENDRMYEILGLPRTAEPVNAARFRSEYVHPDDATEFDRVIGNAVRSGDRFFFQGRFRRGDGELRWVEFSGTPKSAADGTPISILGTAADVTDASVPKCCSARARSGSACWPRPCRRSCGRPSRTARSITSTAGGTSTPATPRARPGMASWAPVIDPETVERVREAWGRSIRTGEPYELEYRLRRAVRRNAPLASRPGAAHPRRVRSGRALVRHQHRHPRPEGSAGPHRAVARVRAGRAGRGRAGEPDEGRVPRHAQPRAAHAAERDPRLVADPRGRQHGTRRTWPRGCGPSSATPGARRRSSKTCWT